MIKFELQITPLSWVFLDISRIWASHSRLQLSPALTNGSKRPLSRCHDTAHCTVALCENEFLSSTWSLSQLLHSKRFKTVQNQSQYLTMSEHVGTANFPPSCSKADDPCPHSGPIRPMGLETTQDEGHLTSFSQEGAHVRLTNQL